MAQTSGSDAAADAARLLERLSFVVLALGGSIAEALSPRAIFVFFPIGIALILVAAILDTRCPAGRCCRSPGRRSRSTAGSTSSS
jgi:hypothetical protein